MMNPKITKTTFELMSNIQEASDTKNNATNSKSTRNTSNNKPWIFKSKR